MYRTDRLSVGRNAMKVKYLIVLVTLVFSTFSNAVELEDATDTELLGELAVRLDIPPDNAIATYLCDKIGNITVDLVSSTGGHEVFVKKLCSPTKCEEQVEYLSRNNHDIRELEQIALCTALGELARYALFTDGNIEFLGKSNEYTYDECFIKARRINGGF